MFGGNLVGGRHADRRLMPMLYTALGGLAVVLLLFTVTAHDKILAAITILLIDALGFAIVAPLQKRVLDQAHGAPNWVGALLAGSALALAVCSAVLERRSGTIAVRDEVAEPAPCAFVGG